MKKESYQNVLKFSFLTLATCFSFISAFSQNGSCGSPDASVGNASSGTNPTFQTCIISPNETTQQIVTYHTVQSSPDGTLGIIQQVSSFPACTDNTLYSSRVAYLYATGDCNGTAIPASIVNAGNSSTFNPEWAGLNPATNYIIVISITVPLTCSGSITQVCADAYYPVGSSCNASIGTYTISTTGTTMTSGSEYTLNTNGQSITITNNNDAVNSPDDANPGDATIGFLIFNQQPTIPFDPSTLTAGQNGFLGAVAGSSISDDMTSGSSSSVSGATALWFVPATFDAGGNGAPYYVDNNGDNCYDIGYPIQVNYSVASQACGDCSNPACSIYLTSNGAASPSATYPSSNYITENANGPGSVTECHLVTVSSNNQTLGFRQSIYQANTGCATRTWNLYAADANDQCTGNPIPETGTGSYSSVFNPEWEYLPAGNYVMCITQTLPAGCDIEYINTGYYLENLPIPPTPACPTDQSFITLDWTQNNPFVPYTNTSFDCNSGLQTIWKNPEQATIASGGELQPYPGFIMDFTTNSSSATKTSVLVSVNGTPYSYYGPSGTAPAGVLDWGPMTVPPNTQLVLEPFLPAGAAITLTICDTRAAVQSFPYTIWDYVNGSILASGTASPNSGNCITVSFTLSAPSLTWTIDGAATGITNNNDGSATFDPSLLSSGNHTITYTYNNSAGCTLTASQTINVSGSPAAPTVSSPVVYCEGDIATALTATGNSLLWYSVASGGVGSSASPTPSTVSSGTTSFWVSQTSGGCEGPRSKIDVTVNNCSCPINLIVANPAAVCSPNTVDLTDAAITTGTTGGGTYTYWVDQNATIPLSNPTIINTTGTYYIMSNNGSCSDIEPVLVSINPIPSVNITVVDESCPGQLDGQITANGSGGSGTANWQYSIDGINFSSSNTFYSLSAGTYTVIVLDITGCTGSSIATLQAAANFTLMTSDDTICDGQSVLLQSGGSQTYAWYDMSTGALISNNNSITVSPTTQTSYTVSGNCGSLTKTIYLYPKPIISAISNKSICAGQTINVNASASSGNGNLNFSWTPAGTSGTTANLGQGAYTVTVTDACNTSDFTSFSVIENPLPEIEIAGDSILCLSSELNLTNNKHTSAMVDYSWNFDDGIVSSDKISSKHNYINDGLYNITLTVTDIKGCTNTSPAFAVQVFLNPLADISTSSSSATILEPVIVFDGTGSSSDVSNFIWNFSGFEQGSLSISTFAFSDTGEHEVKLIVNNSFMVNGELFQCFDSTTTSITITDELTFYIPNAFTPNNDGDNDTFAPKGMGFKSYEMNIFNRWGELVFSTRNPEEGWNGKCVAGDGIIMEDLYVYQINVETFSRKFPKKTYTGHVTLLR